MVTVDPYFPTYTRQVLISQVIVSPRFEVRTKNINKHGIISLTKKFEGSKSRTIASSLKSPHDTPRIFVSSDRTIDVNG